MSNTVYTACFSDNNDNDFFIVCGYLEYNHAINNNIFNYLLHGTEGVDISLRYTKEHITLLLLSYDKHKVKHIIEQLKRCNVKFIECIETFDEYVFLDDVVTLQTDYQEFSYCGNAMGCDFRLFHYWLHHKERDNCIYQITIHHLETHNVKKLQRIAQKYICYLQIENILPHSSAIQQYELLSRPLDRYWLANEVIFFTNEQSLYNWKHAIDDTFAHTSTGACFNQPPLISNYQLDSLILGYHPMRDELRELENRQQTVALVSSLFSQQEIDFLWNESLRLNKQNSLPASTTGKKKVFISYALSDYIEAQNLRSALEKEGFHCWMAPEDINKTNLNYPSAIIEGINASSALIVVFSEHTNNSIHVPKEIDLALSQKLLIIPVRLKNIMPENDLQYLLRLCQWIDKYQRPNKEVIKEIITRLKYCH